MPQDLLEADMSTDKVDRARLMNAKAMQSLHKQGLPPPEPVAPQASMPDGIVNHCPFNCGNDDLSADGHCHHLMGFTTNGITYEPRKKRTRIARDPEGHYLRQPPKLPGVPGELIHEWDGAWYADGQDPQEVKNTDVIVAAERNGRPAFSSRVYRNVPIDF